MRSLEGRYEAWEEEMRGTITGALAGALALFLLGQPATASIVYSVNVTGVSSSADTETVTGTITTDGTIGLLTSSNIIGWSLLATGAIDAGVSKDDPAAFSPPTVSCAPGCITATSTELDVTGLLGFSNVDLAGIFSIMQTNLSFSPSGAAPPFPPLLFEVGVTIEDLNSSSTTSEDFGADNLVLATASSSANTGVPEPSSLSILALGLVLLVFVKSTSRASLI